MMSRLHFKKKGIWNEPNSARFWKPRPDVWHYCQLLQHAYLAAKDVAPHCTIIGGATAGIDLPYISWLLLHGGSQWMDVLSIHPYNSGEQSALVLWSTSSGGNEVSEIPLTGMITSVKDIFGDAYSYSFEAEKLRIIIGESPIYVIGDFRCRTPFTDQ